jgi:hypothetical protein
MWCKMTDVALVMNGMPGGSVTMCSNWGYKVLDFYKVHMVTQNVHLHSQGQSFSYE